MKNPFKNSAKNVSENREEETNSREDVSGNREETKKIKVKLLRNFVNYGDVGTIIQLSKSEIQAFAPEEIEIQ